MRLSIHLGRALVKTTLSALALLLGVGFLPAAPAQAATTWTTNSPNAEVSAQVTLTDSATLTLAIARGSATVVSPSALGIVTSTVDLTRSLAFVSRLDRVVTETYAMTTGKRLNRQNTFNETKLSFTGSGGARMDLVVRVANDRWYIGGISAVAAKNYTTPMPFLGTGQWLADTLRDGSNGSLVRETRVVTNADTLSVPIAANGGFVPTICKYTSGMRQCPRLGGGGGNLALNKPAIADSSCNANEGPAKSRQRQCLRWIQRQVVLG